MGRWERNVPEGKIGRLALLLRDPKHIFEHLLDSVLVLDWEPFLLELILLLINRSRHTGTSRG